MEIARRPNGGVQHRRVRAGGWTAQKRAGFLEVLAQTANVRMAALATEMSVQGAYALRKRDAGFAAAWLEALCDGYAKLDDLMLERALQTIGGYAADAFAAGDEAKAHALSERTILTLMAQHRPMVKAALAIARGPAGEDRAADATLTDTLDEMRARLLAPDAG